MPTRNDTLHYTNNSVEFQHLGISQDFEVELNTVNGQVEIISSQPFNRETSARLRNFCSNLAMDNHLMNGISNGLSNINDDEEEDNGNDEDGNPLVIPPTTEEVRHNQSQNWVANRYNSLAIGQEDRGERRILSTALEDLNMKQVENNERMFDFICSYCQKTGLHIEENTTYKKIDSKIICEKCIADNFFTCEACGGLNDNQNGYFIENPGGMVCVDCYNNSYFQCNNCGDRFHEDYMHDRDGSYYCENCADDYDNDDHDNGYIKSRAYSRGKMDTYCSDEKGLIVKSKRVYSAELETQYPEDGGREAHRELLENMTDNLLDVGVEEDGSISQRGAEWQTPLLQGKKGERTIIDLCKRLTKAGYTTDKTCGLHIHLDTSKDGLIPAKGRDTREHYASKLKAIMAFYLYFEDVMFSFLPPSRRANGYCIPLNENYHIGSIKRASNVDDIEKIWYSTENRRIVEDCKSEHKHHSRYSGINLHTLLSDNHLEIRYHSGTINATKILEWINLHAIILDKISQEKISIDTIINLGVNLDLKDKTEVFFSLLDLSANSKKYFNLRQSKFLEKKPNEEIALEIKD